MIIEILISFFCGIIKSAITGISVAVSLPLSVAYSISNYTGFFGYLVGNDLILAFVGTLTFWLVVRGVVGLVLFIYHQIPFCT